MGRRPGRQLAGVGLLAAVGLLVAGCTEGDADAAPAPTVTVTETVTATPEPEPTPEPETNPDHAWLARSLETRIDLVDMRDILVAGEVDCPNDQPDELGTTLDCEAEDHSTMIVRSLDSGLSERLEGFEGSGDAGMVVTDRYSIMSDSEENLEAAARALDLLDPLVEDL